MKRYSQMGTAMIPGCTSLDGKPAGQWVEWKDVEVLLAELNLFRSERAQTEALRKEPSAWMNHMGFVSLYSGGGYDIPLFAVSPQREKS